MTQSAPLDRGSCAAGSPGTKRRSAPVCRTAAGARRGSLGRRSAVAAMPASCTATLVTAARPAPFRAASSRCSSSPPSMIRPIRASMLQSFEASPNVAPPGTWPRRTGRPISRRTRTMLSSRSRGSPGGCVD